MKIHHYIAYRPEGRTNNYFRTYISPRNINSTSALSCHRVHLMCIRHYIAMISRRTLTATFQHDCSVWSVSLAVHELTVQPSVTWSTTIRHWNTEVTRSQAIA